MWNAGSCVFFCLRMEMAGKTMKNNENPTKAGTPMMASMEEHTGKGT